MNTRLLKIIGLIAIPLIILSISSSWIFEWMWLSELGYTEIFWTLKGTQIILVLLSFLVAAVYFIFNFRFLAGQLQYANLSASPLQGSNINIGSDFVLKRIRQFFTLGALVFALFFALSFYLRWDESLRFISSMPVGEADPLFGKDVGFYMFRLPFWDMIQGSLVSVSFITTALLALAYIFSGLLMVKSPTSFDARSSVLNHLKVNIAIWLLFLAWGFWLARYKLVLNTGGLVYGATYTDVAIHLPALWILFVLTLLIAVVMLVGYKLKANKIVPIAAGLILIVLVVGRGLLPGMVQQFQVVPNELELETPYLESNIEMTRLAYNLHTIREIDYQAEDTLGIADIRNNQDAVDNIRLWDPRLLINTYKQLQEIRSYYEFYNVDNDRYTVDGKVTQMMLAAREIARELPSQSDTWQNRHMQYTHGFGMVMSPVTEANSQGEPNMIVRNIPPAADSPELEVENPAIYYGENSSGYYIVNTELDELHYPDGNENVYINYDGTGGIQFSSYFRKLLFAWELGDINILLTDDILPESRLQIWRSVQERVNRITPFLTLDRDPYLVMQDGRLFWIQDAYTTSSSFPYSQPYNNRFNYIRNSVKIVIDAYNGSVDYYMIDEEDPVLEVYRSIFPDLFKPASEIPAGLEEHFRYPQDLFEVQLEIFNRYHMTRPQVFYNQEDLWERPNEKYGGRQVIMEPYYVLARLPGEEKLEFMLISPLTPENRDNMISWIAAKSDPGSYGELVVYRLPKERLIYGPAQIDARIDQDPEISRQIALWDQRGSRVIRGNLMVIPIEDSFLYVEPVFLLAEGVDIPQLQRVIVSIGDNISMQPTIEQAIFDIFGQSDEFVLPGVEPIAADSLTGIQLPEQAVSTITARQLEEIQTLWSDMRSALEDGNWTRYGELLAELDELINNL
ncbi:UPF0182 family protein [Rhodohalobacter mucosus]|uniref:UPF0182 protein DDZ15_13815 n=1 Tax=Rhodohalobacter mucosus TaxID=2079485 RepID=A0A316TTQ8_9BACT|nr:UPF0182 family protein [Rhodohalobacter mucosus]PWN05662.1 UPF0182 family protein [Rhodohalobacter mucosus]